MVESNLCPVCGGGAESKLHILLDCPQSKAVWQHFLGNTFPNCLSSDSPRSRIFHNISPSARDKGGCWAIRFGLTV